MSDFQNLLREGYRFEMSKYIDDGWKLYTKGAGSFIGFLLLFILISIVLSVVGTIIPFASIITPFVTNTIFAGMFIFCRQLSKGHQEFGDFFQGFQSFGQLALFYLVMLLISSPMLILYFTYFFPFDMFMGIMDGSVSPDQVNEEMTYRMMENVGTYGWIMLLLVIFSIYISISYIFTLPLIVDAKLGFWRAMETSRRIVGKKFFGFLGMFILLGILGAAGILFTCGLGAFVVGPFFICIIFVAYDRIFTPYMDNLQADLENFGMDEGNDSHME